MTDKPVRDMEAEYATFYHLAGEIVREWAELEVGFGWLLSALLGTSGFRARVIWDSMPNFRARHQLIARLGETFLDESILPKFRGLMKRVKKAAANRNTIAHCWGGVDKIDHIVFLFDQDRAEQGYNFVGNQVVHIKNIRDWCETTKLLKGEIIDLYKEMTDKVHALPKMHRARRGDHPTSQPADHQQGGGQGQSGALHEEPQPQPQSFRLSLGRVEYRWLEWLH
jgi:hypothetical protein